MTHKRPPTFIPYDKELWGITKNGYALSTDKEKEERRKWLKDSPLMNADKAYIAGFLDGDGSIGIYKGQGTSVICRVTINTQDRPLLEWIQQLYGGTIALSGGYGKSVGGSFYWLAAGTCNVVEFLNDIIPYMRLKADQAQLVLEYKSWQSKASPGVGHRGPEAEKYKTELISRSKSLNARTSASFRKYRKEANG